MERKCVMIALFEVHGERKILYQGSIIEAARNIPCLGIVSGDKYFLAQERDTRIVKADQLVWKDRRKLVKQFQKGFWITRNSVNAPSSEEKYIQGGALQP